MAMSASLILELCDWRLGLMIGARDYGRERGVFVYLIWIKVMFDRLRKAREKRARFKRLASEMRAEFGAMHYPTLAEWFWGRRA
jgi:hypothetical protein